MALVNSIAHRMVNQISSSAWSFINLLRRRCFEAKLLPQTNLPSRVVSVGNLQAGGSGKTPLVIQLAQEAHSRGKTVLILLRGVGGKWESSGGLISPNTPAPNFKDAGDEALLLHWKCPHAWIAVGSDRVAGFSRAVEKMGKNPDITILDDGFQHLKIHRHVDLLCVTSSTSSEIPFREFVNEAERASLWIFTKGNQVPFQAQDKRWVKLKRKFPPAPTGKKFWMISAIANPLAAKTELEKAGYAIEKTSFFPDHHLWEESDAKTFSLAAEKTGLKILLTGKDFVKWPGDRGLVEVVEPEIEITEGADQWNRVLWG